MKQQINMKVSGDHNTQVMGDITQRVVVVNSNVHYTNAAPSLAFDSLPKASITALDALIAEWVSTHHALAPKPTLTREDAWRHIKDAHWENLHRVKVYIQERINWENNKAFRRKQLETQMAKYQSQDLDCERLTAP